MRVILYYILNNNIIYAAWGTTLSVEYYCYLLYYMHIRICIVVELDESVICVIIELIYRLHFDLRHRHVFPVVIRKDDNSQIVHLQHCVDMVKQ